MATGGDGVRASGSCSSAACMSMSLGNLLPPLIPPRSSSFTVQQRSPGMPLLLSSAIEVIPTHAFDGVAIQGMDGCLHNHSVADLVDAVNLTN